MSNDTVLDEHILSMVQRLELAEQADLQAHLKEIGYDIPQATLSRKLKKLKCAKVAGIYKIVDFQTSNLPLILNIQVSEQGLIVLHTQPSNASSLALFIDKKYVAFSPKQTSGSGILGTIAGDDTVLLIIKSRACLDSVLALLQQDFPYLNLPTATTGAL
ncbi:MAG: ArgR family transcriptional regulator [Legionellales bacterium]